MPDLAPAPNLATEGLMLPPVRTLNYERHTSTLTEVEQAVTAAGGEIPFSQFMGIALYGRDGYYSAGRADIRAHGGGDFHTYPQLSTDFCEAMGVAALKLWKAMDGPHLDLVESGAGTGVLIKDAMVWMRETQPDMYRKTSFHIIEPGDMARHQRRTIAGQNDPITIAKRGSRAEESTLAEHGQDLSKVSWHRESAIGSTVGTADATIFMSNELPDAFPVEEVRNTNGVLEQKFVRWEDGGPVEVWRPLQPDVQAYIDEFSITIEDKHAIAVNLGAVKWQRNLGRVLKRGGIITVDYGDYGHRQIGLESSRASVSRLGAVFGQDTAGHHKGAVRTYPTGHNPLDIPGQLDITSDVDFRVLAEVAKGEGLEVAFNGTQPDFLYACGVPSLNELSDVGYPRSATEVIRMDATRQANTANGFRALVLTRGVEVDFSVREPLLPAYDRLIPRS